MKQSLLYLALLLTLQLSAQQQIILAEYRSNNNPTGGESGAAGAFAVTASGVTRGPGITYVSGSDYSAKNFTTGYYVDLADYVQLTIAPISGYKLTLTQLGFNFVRDALGPTRIEVRSSKDNFASSIYYDNAIGTGNNSTSFSLGSQFQDLSSTLTIRIYGCRATSSAGILKVSAISGYTKTLLPAGAQAGVYIRGIRTQIPVPANDNCENAVLLPVTTSCSNTSGINAGATASTPAPSGLCNTTGYKDVWYKFTMPNVSLPQVTIRTTAGTLTDAVMEVYTGSICANKVYVTCEDDNSNGNGSLMPVISLQGSPGATVWVRIWGYNGSSGTFGICVLNYLTANLVENNGGSSNSLNAKVEGLLLNIGDDKNINGFPPDNRKVNSPQIQITPNPAQDVVQVKFLQSEECRAIAIRLSDLSGKIVIKRLYDYLISDEVSEQFDVTEIDPGTYFLQVITTKGVFAEKMIIAH